MPNALSAQMQRAADTVPRPLRLVLVADDSQIARRRVVSLLRQMGIDCVVARDGREALEQLLALSSEPGAVAIDLVISDIEMPRLDGYALTRAIREAPALRRLKVILHSSLSGGFNEALVREVNANRFVAKFQPDLLAQAVLDLLAVDAVPALAR